MTDAHAMFAASRRPIVLGIGGGGDVAGALATAEVLRLYHHAHPILGGVSWERRVIDPMPGPRSLEEIVGGTPLAPHVLRAGPTTRIGASGVTFAEAHMARFLGEDTWLCDVLSGPKALATGLETAAKHVGADLLVFIDVGGDSIARGDEPGLASPLCDALMLACAAVLQRRGNFPVLAGIFGAGCDGELTIDELMTHLAEIAAGGGLAGAHGLTWPVVSRLDQAVRYVPTEASAQALRCFRGEYGRTTIRGGRRTVPLSPVGALTLYFDAAVAVSSVARLAAAVTDTTSLEESNEVLHGLGIGTELDLESEGSDR